jgi:hypothetical protein
MNEYLKERELWWPVRSDLMASYCDGSQRTKWPDGSLRWRRNGQYHRDDDKPARIDPDGTLTWAKNSQLHRDLDKPARILADGELQWYKNGKQHRDDDKPAVIWADGTVAWFKNDKCHRSCGPAVIRPNNKHEYWINDVNITEEVNAWLKTRKYKYPFTTEQQVEFTLTFS